MLGIAMAGLLATSLGNPNPGGLTATLQVAALEPAVPNLLLRESILANEAPEAATTAYEEPHGKGWLGAGIAGGALSVGVGAGILAGKQSHDTFTGFGVGVATGLVAGVGGYFLGRLADEGSVAAQISVVVLDAVAAAFVGYGIWLTGHPPSS